MSNIFLRAGTRPAPAICVSFNDYLLDVALLFQSQSVGFGKGVADSVSRDGRQINSVYLFIYD